MDLATALQFPDCLKLYRKTMLELKIAYKYIIVIIIGIAIFLLDLYNETGSTLNESILILAGLFKSVYFIKFTFKPDFSNARAHVEPAGPAPQIAISYVSTKGSILVFLINNA